MSSTAGKADAPGIIGKELLARDLPRISSCKSSNPTVEGKSCDWSVSSEQQAIDTVRPAHGESNFFSIQIMPLPMECSSGKSRRHPVASEHTSHDSRANGRRGGSTSASFLCTLISPGDENLENSGLRWIRITGSGALPFLFWIRSSRRSER